MNTDNVNTPVIANVDSEDDDFLTIEIQTEKSARVYKSF
jgi:hypothetical protein